MGAQHGRREAIDRNIDVATVEDDWEPAARGRAFNAIVEAKRGWVLKDEVRERNVAHDGDDEEEFGIHLEVM